MLRVQVNRCMRAVDLGLGVGLPQLRGVFPAAILQLRGQGADVAAHLRIAG